MKRLFLMRHAKAARADPILQDFDRPLEEEGRLGAAKVAGFMAAKGFVPDFSLCSPALRAAQTLAVAARAFPEAAPARFPEALYNAAPDAVRDEIAGAPASAASVLVVGHNPGVHALALDLALASSSDAQALMRLHRSFPPGAVAVFALPIADWTDIATAKGALLAFAAPKELA